MASRGPLVAGLVVWIGVSAFGGAGSSSRGPDPVAATARAGWASLWLDGDSRWTASDRERAEACWPEGGVEIATGGGVAEPELSVHPAAALLVGWAGSRSAWWLDGLAIGLLVLLLASLRPDLPAWGTAAFLAGSASLGLVGRGRPELATAVILLAGLGLARRDGPRSGSAGGLALGLAGGLLPWTLPVAVVAVAERWIGGDRQGAVVVLALVLVVAGGLGLVAAPPADLLRSMTGEVPVVAREVGLASGLVGRASGLVPYFPLAPLGLLVALSSDRRRRVLPLGGGILLAAVWAGGYARAPLELAAPGPELFAVLYPLVYLLLPSRLPAWSLAAAALLVGGLTMPALGSAPAEPSPVLGQLPLEPDLVPWGDRLGFEERLWGGERWLVAPGLAFGDEGAAGGVWLRPDRRGELWLVRRRTADALSTRIGALDPEVRVRLETRGEGVVVDFDTPAKREGTPVRLSLEPEAVVRDPRRSGDVSRSDEGLPLVLYRVEVTVQGGAVPARLDPGSDDHRRLGAFLRFPEVVP